MRRVIYPKQDKAIYMWKLNIDGSITKEVIECYRINHYGYQDHYLFKLENSTSGHSLRSSQLNRFVNNRYCSFEDNDSKAIKAIKDALKAKANKLREEYESVEKLIELLRDNN